MGKQKKAKRKPCSKKPGNESGPPRVEGYQELGPTQCDFDHQSVGKKTQCNRNPEFGYTKHGKLCSESNITNANLNPTQTSSPLTNDSMYCTEEELENLLLKKLEMIYSQALVKLTCSGYRCDVVFKAILANGHGFGDEDILTNIVQNAVEHIKTGHNVHKGRRKDSGQFVGEIQLLVKNSLEAMIHSLCQSRSNMKKGEAMWCLLMSNFHLGAANTLKVPAMENDGKFQVAEGYMSIYGSSGVDTAQGDRDIADHATSYLESKRAAKKLGAVLDNNLNSLKSLNLTPSLQMVLKKTVSSIAATCRDNLMVPPEETEALKNSFPGKMSVEKFEWEDSCMVNLMLDGSGRRSGDKDLATKSVDCHQKIEMISSLVHDIKEVKEQVKDQKEWAQTKVLDAAKRLGHDLLELKVLRTERDKKQQLESGEGEIEEKTMKKLMEMEKSVDQAACEYSLFTMGARNMEIGNAELRAEVEAFRLRASETDEMCAEVLKREKKALKKTGVFEKQNKYLQEEIKEERKKSQQLQLELVDLKKAQEDLKVMWRQDVKAKELAINQLEKELRLKEESEVSTERRQQEFREKMEVGYLQYKDDIQQLEQEIANLEMSSEHSDHDIQHLPDYLFSWELEFPKTQGDMELSGSNEVKDLSKNKVTYDRMCLICSEKEASVVFLPCAHQVLCSNCEKNYYNNVKPKCPYCNGSIDQRIHAYGIGS